MSVGTVTMVVGFLLFLLALGIAHTIDIDSGPQNIAAQTSMRWNDWDTVSGVLGVTLMVLGGIISYVDHRRRGTS